MIIDINFIRFAKVNLPVHKIQTNRFKLLNLLLRELQSLFDNFVEFRREKLIEQNINHSTKSIEYWLNYKVKEGLRIIEQEESNYKMELSRKSEADDKQILAQKTEASDYVELERKGEESGAEFDEDFAVKYDSSLTNDEKENINIIVERYRAAGTTYKIISS
jgi:hypothetical protein